MLVFMVQELPHLWVYQYSNLLTGQMFDVPVMGTHAHSWIMSFDDEYLLFIPMQNYIQSACTLLVYRYYTFNSKVNKPYKTFK